MKADERLVLDSQIHCGFDVREHDAAESLVDRGDVYSDCREFKSGDVNAVVLFLMGVV